MLGKAGVGVVSTKKVSPAEWPNVAFTHEINAVCGQLQKLARDTESDWIEMLVRADGRVEFRGEYGPYTLWQIDADTDQESAVHDPCTALHAGPCDMRKPDRS